MPAASCRIMPARSINRCDTISASFGFSFRIGRKYRDNRISTPQESAGSSSESGLSRKTQDRDLGKAAKLVDFLTFYRSGSRDQALVSPARRNHLPARSPGTASHLHVGWHLLHVHLGATRGPLGADTLHIQRD